MTETNNIGKKLRTAGLVTAIVSLVIGMLFAVTIGRSCGFLGSLVIVFCFLVSLVGGVLFVSGFFIQKRTKRIDSENRINSTSR